MTERHWAQVEAGAPLRKRLWQAIDAAKLRQQGRALKAAGRDDAGLTALACRVRSGDPDDLEAQGAQRYWPKLFGRKFRRDRGADDANAPQLRLSARHACIAPLAADTTCLQVSPNRELLFFRNHKPIRNFE
jgi:hypothetical protein